MEAGNVYTIPIRRLSVWGLVVAVLFLRLADGQLAQAEDSFVAESGLQYTFPGVNAPLEGISFWLASKSGKISGVSIRPEEIKDASGRLLSLDSLSSWQAAELTPAGTLVTLKPKPGRFLRPGSYKVRLVIQGTQPSSKKPTEPQTVELVLNRLAAEINLDEIKDTTFELTRNYPGGQAGGTGILDLRETTGMGLADLTGSEHAIYREASKIQVPGKVAVRIENFRVKLTFSGIKKTGALTSGVTLASPSLAQDRTVPVKILVTDPWGWALIVIALGVIGGYLTHYLAEKWRPRRLNTYTIVRLRGDIDHYLGVVETQDKLDILEDLRSRLREAEEQSTFSDAAVAATKLAQIDQDLAAFRKRLAGEKSAARTRLGALRAQIGLYRQNLQGQATSQEEQFFKNNVAKLLDIESLLATDNVDAAQRELDDVAARFAALKTTRLEQDLDALQQELDPLVVPQGQEQEKKTLQAQVASARALLKGGKLDEAQEQIDQIRNRLVGLGSATAGALSLQGLTAISGLRSAGADEVRIAMEGSAAEATTDSPIAFEIEAPGGQIQPGDELQWHFGEGGGFEKGNQKTSHLYREPGDYQVRAQIVRKNEITEQVAVSITVLPGKTDARLASLRRQILRADFVLSAIALLLACLTGLLYLYVSKPFGSLAEYLGALLWGFGIDNSVRGFAAVLSKITTT